MATVRNVPGARRPTYRSRPSPPPPHRITRVFINTIGSSISKTARRASFGPRHLHADLTKSAGSKPDLGQVAGRNIGRRREHTQEDGRSIPQEAGELRPFLFGSARFRVSTIASSLTHPFPPRPGCAHVDARDRGSSRSWTWDSRPGRSRPLMRTRAIARPARGAGASRDAASHEARVVPPRGEREEPEDGTARRLHLPSQSRQAAKPSTAEGQRRQSAHAG